MTDDSNSHHEDGEESPRLAPDVYRGIIAQKRRHKAYEAGVYELSDDEGFRCADCGWQGLSAPANLDADIEAGEPITVCPECGAPVETQGTSQKYLESFRPKPGAPDYLPPHARDGRQ